MDRIGVSLGLWERINDALREKVRQKNAPGLRRGDYMAVPDDGA